MPSRQLLIDGDIIAYRFATESSKAINWGDGVVSGAGDVEQAEKRVARWLEQMMNKLKASTFIIALSDPSRRYFRHNIWPDYKKNRTQGTPPPILPEVKAMLRERYEAKVKPALEADDVLGILATWDDHCPGCEKVIVSLDKDMATIPCLHFDYHKDEDVRWVTEDQADYNHFTQTLTGDVCDGYPGCRGIGPKKAARILDPCRTDSVLMWLNVVEEFEKRGMTAEDALLQARMARILRAEDWDFSNQKVIPWQPPMPSSPTSTSTS